MTFDSKSLIIHTDMKLNHPLTFSWKSLNRQGHSHGCPLSGIGEKLSTHPTDRGNGIIISQQDC